LRNSSSLLLGITREDLYPRSEDSQFCFGWRAGQIRSAVVRTPRRNLRHEGEPIADSKVKARSEKLVRKEIGILNCRKNPSGNPRSVLFNGILGIQELDLVSDGH
jgi:predicted Zn-dependent protease